MEEGMLRRAGLLCDGPDPTYARLSSPLSSRLALPVETLSEIFKIALTLLLHPPTPFDSSVSPNQDFASILLASHTFRSLAIPYVYRTITIAKPDDWTAFFGVGRGVFVAGYDVAAERAALEHICLVEEAALPIDLGICDRSWVTLSAVERALIVSSGSGWQVECLVPLAFGDLNVKSLTMLSLLKVDAEHVERLGEDEIDQLVDLLVQDDAVCAHVEIQADDSVKIYLDELIYPTCESLQGQAIVSFLRALRPPTIMLANQFSTLRLVSHGQEIHRDAIKLVEHPSNSAQEVGRQSRSGGGSPPTEEYRRAFPGAVFETARETGATPGGHADATEIVPGWWSSGWDNDDWFESAW